MGLLSWLFPSPDDRVRAARAFLAEGRPAEARRELLELDHPDAKGLIVEAEQALALRNLEDAQRWADAGNEERVADSLELAEEYHHGGLEEQFRAVRRRIRENRQERTASEQREREDRQARLLAVDPLGLTGGPSLLRGVVPDDLAAEDAQEISARLDLLVDGYPEDLRERLPDAGAPFARAVLDLDEGRADLALQALLALDADHPLVCWETARAAVALGDPAAAARTLKRFATLAGGHRKMGQQHTGAVLGQLLAQIGDLAGAIPVLEASRADAPDAAGFPLAQVLATTGRLAEAEQVLRALVTRNPRVQPYYALLARIRLLGGYRVEAMTALEQGLSTACCSPAGKCGAQAPDVHLVRQLAILYLEDARDLPRALELADQARDLVRQPGFEDLYLAALAARARRARDASPLAQAVWAQVGDDDARRAHLGRYLPIPA